MNGFILLLPFLCIRFGLLSYLNKEAIQRAAHFPPMVGNEKIAYYLYHLATIAILLYMCICNVTFEYHWIYYLGIILYCVGLLLCTISIINFASPNTHGLHRNGLYKYSRNPMYVGYFIYFIGCSIWLQSFILFLFVLLFQITAHWIILAEERWCLTTFTQSYVEYMKEVRRYC